MLKQGEKTWWGRRSNCIRYHGQYWYIPPLLYFSRYNFIHTYQISMSFLYSWWLRGWSPHERPQHGISLVRPDWDIWKPWLQKKETKEAKDAKEEKEAAEAPEETQPDEEQTEEAPPTGQKKPPAKKPPAGGLKRPACAAFAKAKAKVCWFLPKLTQWKNGVP